MSLKESSLSSIVLKQYVYKLKGHSGLVYSLMFTQLIGLLLSMGPRGSTSSGSEFLSVSVRTYSADTTLLFSCVWIIVMASLLGSKGYRSMEFSLVTNRISSHLSNILLLVTYSVFAGMTSTSMSGLHRIIMVITLNPSEFIFDGLRIAPADLLLGILVSSLYMFLLAAGAYLIRMIIELNKSFGVILSLVLLAFVFGTVRIFALNIENLMRFYTSESSLGIFVLKVLLTVLVLFGLSILTSNRMEVKR